MLSAAALASASSPALALVSNTATVTGQTPAGQVVTSQPSTANVMTEPANPSVETVASIVYIDDDGIPGHSAGDTVRSTFSVRSTGNLTLDVDGLTPLLFQNGNPLVWTTSPGLIEGNGDGLGNLYVGEVWTWQGEHTLSQAMLDDGNDLTATGNFDATAMGQQVSSTATTSLELTANPGVVLAKVATTPSFSVAGETIEWNLTATNSGNLTLAPLVLSDTGADAVQCPISGDETIASLSPGASVTCIASRTTTPADVAARRVDNTANIDATAANGAIVQATASATIAADPADLVTDLQLVSGTTSPAPGDVVTFGLSITNNGPGAASNLSTTLQLPTGLDPAPGPAIATSGTYDPGTGLWSVPVLGIGETAVLTLDGIVPPGLTFAPVVIDALVPTSDQVDPLVNDGALSITLTPGIRTIVARDDAPANPVDAAQAVTVALNVLDGDVLGGQPADAATVTAQAVGDLPTGFVLNADGTVSLARFTAPGTYAFDYRICEIANPANCAEATVNLTVFLSAPRISGILFDDKNGNGALDPNEPAKPGYAVQLRKPDGSVVAETQSATNGAYALSNFVPGDYEIIFIAPTGIAAGQVDDLEVADEDVVLSRNIPVDPSGIIYDSLTGQPVAGVLARLLNGGTEMPLPDQCLLDNQQDQMTGPDGSYRFDIIPGADAACPLGAALYRLALVVPDGYLDPPSAEWPPRPGALDARRCEGDRVAGPQCGLAPTNEAPPLNAPSPYFMTFTIGQGFPDIIHNHIPLDPLDNGLLTDLTLLKSSNVRAAKRGDAIVYALRLTNAASAPFGGLVLKDRLPTGLSLIADSASVDGNPAEMTAQGGLLTLEGVSVPAEAETVIRYAIRVGANAAPGEVTNQARIETRSGRVLTETASATIRIDPEQVFDCGDVLGKVFNDLNRNGYQDEDEPGLPGTRVATVRGTLITTDEFGRFSVPCAELPDQDIGTNFIMKLDESSLPAGFVMTTENPRVVRLTAGKTSEISFGAAESGVVRIDLDATAFLADSPRPTPELDAAIRALAEQLPSGQSVIRLSYARGSEDEALARARLGDLELRLRLALRNSGSSSRLVVEKRVISK